MITLRPITQADVSLFKDTSYESMDEASAVCMIEESQNKAHNGQYFELFTVEDDGQCVGFVSLFALSKTEISCGPEIKPLYRRLGYAFAALEKALEYAKSIGFSRAVAQVRKDNTASIALHNKLNFICTKEYTNKKGNLVCWFEKAL